MVYGLLRNLHDVWFRFARVALFNFKIPWTYRWRLLAFQPLGILAYALSSSRYIFSRPYAVEYISIDKKRWPLRVLVFKYPSPSGDESKPRPLHLDFHAGGFMGGLPETGAPFLERVAKETGAVVVSTSYRLGPEHTFPAGHDDADAVLAYLLEHGPERYGIDPTRITTSGHSAGGNLALSTSLAVPGGIMASVIFYGAIELRLKPEDKPKSEKMKEKVKFDPMSWMLPLYDSYAGPVRAQNMKNPRMSPVIADIDDLPENILAVVPAMDILVHEQTSLIERLKAEAAEDPKYAGRRFEIMNEADGFHGYLEIPERLLGRGFHQRAYNAGVQFIRDAHRKHGWNW